MNDHTKLLYALIPPVFALITIFSSKFENTYFEKQAKNLSHKLNRPSDQSRFANIAKSVSALKDHIATITSVCLSLLITFHAWPDPWRYIVTATIAGLFLLLFQPWVWNIFSQPLDGISGSNVPKKKRHLDDKAFHENYTYADRFTRFNIILNIVLLIVILVGYILF